MDAGVLIYCFDTEQTKYSRLAKRSIDLIKKNLKLPVTVVTDADTRKDLNFVDVNYKIVNKNTNNFRYYRGKNIPWYNMERANAFDYSPYEKTILLDCDYMCFTDNLLELLNTDYDFLLHNKVNDITGLDRIQGKLESILPIVWATVVIFEKSENAKLIFDMIKHVQQNYSHFRNLYRIKFKNYRNDYAFAIALHQLNGHLPSVQYIPTPMNMLPHEFDVLDVTDDSIIYQYNKKINIISNTDVHVMDKEFVNVG